MKKIIIIKKKESLVMALIASAVKINKILQLSAEIVSVKNDQTE